MKSLTNSYSVFYTVTLVNQTMNIILKSPPSGTPYVLTLPNSSGSANQVLQTDGAGTLSWVSLAPVTGGTVTSVGLSAPSIFTVTGSPVTSAGNLTITYSGVALPITSGGTGLTSVGAAGQVLTSNGTFMEWQTPASPGTGTVTSVDLAVPTAFTVSGNPITTSGTMTIGYSGTAIPVANGGTGSTTSTGTAASGVVLATLPSINRPTFTSTANAAAVTINNTTGLGQLISGSNTSVTSNCNLVALSCSTLSSGFARITYGQTVGSAWNAVSLDFNFVSAGSSSNSFGIGFILNQNLYNFSGTVASFTKPLTVTGAVTASSLVFTSGGSVTFNPPSSGSYSLKWPTSAGSANQVLTTDGATGLSWTSPGTGSVTSVACTVPNVFSISGSPITTSGTLAISYSGTALPVANGGTGLTAGGTPGQVLTMVAGVPAWATPGVGGTVTSVDATATSTIFSITGGPITTSGTLAFAYNGTALPVANGGTGLTAGGTNGQVLTIVSGSPAWSTPGVGGTVTSVACTVPSIFSISGSPITTSGTLAISYSGTALPTANGGTGLTTVGTNGQVLTSSGTTLSWQTPSAPGTGTVTSVDATASSTIFSITGGPITTSGTLALAYNGTALPVSSGGTGLTVGGTPGQVLTMVAGSPAWANPATSGTVTSVGLSAPSIFTVSGSPVTSTGTLTLTYSGTALPIANGGTATNTATGNTGSYSVVCSNGPTIATPTLTGGTVMSINTAASVAAITNTTSSGSPGMLDMKGSGLTVSGYLENRFGRDNSNYNTVLLRYNYLGVNSNINNYSIGFFGAANIYNFSGVQALFNRNVQVNETAGSAVQVFGGFTPSMTAGQKVGTNLGESLATGNFVQTLYTHQGNNNANSQVDYGFPTGGKLTLYNSTTKPAVLTQPLRSVSSSSTLYMVGNQTVPSGPITIGLWYKYFYTGEELTISGGSGGSLASRFTNNTVARFVHFDVVTNWDPTLLGGVSTLYLRLNDTYTVARSTNSLDSGARTTNNFSITIYMNYGDFVEIWGDSVAVIDIIGGTFGDQYVSYMSYTLL